MNRQYTCSRIRLTSSKHQLETEPQRPLNLSAITAGHIANNGPQFTAPNTSPVPALCHPGAHFTNRV